MRDLRFGLRSLRQSPGFAATAILTLALGVGANTAVFSVMNAVLLRSLPVSDPDRLVYLRTSNPPRGTGTIDSNRDVLIPGLRCAAQPKPGLSPVMAYVPLSGRQGRGSLWGTAGRGRRRHGERHILLRPRREFAAGRGFTEKDETDHASDCRISYNYWTRRFARNRDVLGKILYVNGVPMTIVGVSAQGFEGVETGGSTDFWIPLQNRPRAECVGQSAGRRQTVHCESNLVVPAADWASCTRESPRRRRQPQLAAGVSAGSLRRPGFPHGRAKSSRC